MSVTIRTLRDVDPRLVRNLVQRMKALGKVHVGVPEGAAPREGVNTATIAATHEYGGGNVPERPWLRNTINSHLPDYKRLNKINLVKVMREIITPIAALELLGQFAKGHVQSFIYTNDYQLSPVTIARKGSSKALVDTGAFAQSINYVLPDA